jgi:DUF1365 family protein
MVNGAGPVIAFGRVAHERLRPVKHGFSYRVFFLRIPLSRWADAGTRLLAMDGFNLFSLRRADFGPRDGSDLEAWARALLSRHGLEAPGEIVLQAFPRILGYAFNPIALFACHDDAGRLRAVICQVSNTFGECHNYLVAHADGRPMLPSDELRAAKVFHVSPFCEVAGSYRFRFGGTAPRNWTRIDYDDAQGALISTVMHGREKTLKDLHLLRAFTTYPLMTVAVIGRIHWQALRLWAKRVPWFHKPQPPLEETTR